jgi:hypothetical protein
MFNQILPYCLNSEKYPVISLPRALSRNLHKKKENMMAVVFVSL